MAVASASVRPATENVARVKRMRNEGRKEGGGVENWRRVGYAVGTSKRRKREREKGWLRASAPQESGGISVRAGEKHLLDASWAGRWKEREDRGKTASERERDSEGWLRRGCKCPRDVSDRCGSSQTPPSLYPLTTRPKNVLQRASHREWITTVLFLSS